VGSGFGFTMRSNLSINRTDAARAADAQRQRRRRARAREGDAFYRLVLSEFDVVDALLTSGRMSEDASRRKALVEQALADVVRDWIARWKI
jgi:hypothetical protein